MSDFNVRPIGDLEILSPLLAQLHEAGAIETTDMPSLVLVGAASVLEAELLLLNISPLLRRRTVIVGIDEPLDFGFVPGSHTALLAQMQVLGSLPSNCAASPTITNFIGARGPGDGLAYLVDAAWSLTQRCLPGRYPRDLVWPQSSRTRLRSLHVRNRKLRGSQIRRPYWSSTSP